MEDIFIPGELLKLFFLGKPIKFKKEDEKDWNLGELNFVPFGSAKCNMSILTTKTTHSNIVNGHVISLTHDTIELLRYHSGEATFYLTFPSEYEY